MGTELNVKSSVYENVRDYIQSFVIVPLTFNCKVGDTIKLINTENTRLFISRRINLIEECACGEEKILSLKMNKG